MFTPTNEIAEFFYSWIIFVIFLKIGLHAIIHLFFINYLFKHKMDAERAKRTLFANKMKMKRIQFFLDIQKSMTANIIVFFGFYLYMN